MEYYSPTELGEAYSLLGRYGEAAIPIAGSSFYMGHREELFDEVEVVVNIKRLGLSYIKLEKDVLKIGATTTLNELFAHDLSSTGAFRILADTVSRLNINEVRNVATIGGEVCIAGEVDLPTTLLAYGADIVIGSENGTRTMPMEKFHKGYLNNALEPGEMVIEVQIPKPPKGAGGGFGKFERTAADLPIVNAAARLAVDGKGSCKEIRVAVGAAPEAGIPVRAVDVEAALAGKEVNEKSILEAAAAARSVRCVNDFRASAELRSTWVTCAVEDALTMALERVRGGG